MAPETPHPLIHILPDQKHVVEKGASMRLGTYKCQLVAGSLAEKLYGASSVEERHRHRYEVNNDYREQLSKLGLRCSGLSPDYRLVEIIEIPGHPFFIATQFHPEFRSRPNRAHPLFSGLIAAAIERSPRLFAPEQKKTQTETKLGKNIVNDENLAQSEEAELNGHAVVGNGRNGHKQRPGGRGELSLDEASVGEI